MMITIVIDATRQLPSEGGPGSFARDLIMILEEYEPESFEIVEKSGRHTFESNTVRRNS